MGSVAVVDDHGRASWEGSPSWRKDVQGSLTSSRTDCHVHANATRSDGRSPPASSPSRLALAGMPLHILSSVHHRLISLLLLVFHFFGGALPVDLRVCHSLGPLVLVIGESACMF